MSNFSTQYRQFKDKKTLNPGKSSERRQINLGKVRKNYIASDLYFHGQITSEEETAQTSPGFNHIDA